jgi:hypothetical protein
MSPESYEKWSRSVEVEMNKITKSKKIEGEAK